MARELNLGIFSNDPATASVKSELSTQVTASQNETRERQRDLVIKDLILQVKELKKRSRDQENQITQMQRQLNQLHNGQMQVGERFSTQAQRLESLVRSQVQEFKESLAQVKGQMTEKKVLESKVQDLVDRQTVVLQTFETRLKQLQKLTSEQEFKLLALTAKK